MKFKMFIRMIYGAINRRKSRMFIALLSIVCGSLIIFGMLTIYRDIPKQFNEEFKSYGANLIILPNNQTHLSQDEVNDLKRNINQSKLQSWTPYQYESVQVNHQNFVVSASNLAEVKESNPYWLVDGQWPKSDKEALVGAEVAETINAKIGDDITLEAVDTEEKEGQFFKKNTGLYTISGIVHTGGSEEETIFVDTSQMAKLYPKKEGFDLVECGIEGNHDELTQFTKELGEKCPFSLPRIAQRLTKSQDLILDKLTRLVWMIVIIMSCLTAISITTTMYAIVAERTEEIGLKKAIGASDKAIITEFLGECTTIALIGSLIGCYFGYYFAQFISRAIFARSVGYELWLVIPVVILMILITGVACYLPVRKTTTISPDIVLRGE